MSKKSKDNAIVLAILIILSLVYLFGKHLDEITLLPFIVPFCLFFYVIFLLISFYSENPYGYSESIIGKIFDIVCFWLLPIISGYMLASILGGYYTDKYGKEEPIYIAKIVDKSISSGKGRTRYLHVVNKDKEHRSITVSSDSYKRAQLGECVGIQYKTSSVGRYLEYWKFVNCPNYFALYEYGILMLQKSK